ncbi:MAG: hypothetical protein M3Z96_08725 [Pseudomonadota bacterium]|nr:hypothetical protein [Pseudomonadota bacterium]
MSAIVATNLDEFSLKARYVNVAECVAESIVDDLLAIGRKSKATASKEAKGSLDGRRS